MFSAPPLPPLFPGPRLGRVRCGARELCDFRSWDRLGLLGDEAAKRFMVESLSGQSLVEFSSRAALEPGSTRTAFEKRLAERLRSQYCLYFPSQTQAYLSALAALVTPGSLVLADPLALAPLDDAAALLDLSIIRHSCSSKEDLLALLKHESVLSRPSASVVLWIEHSNPISSKAFDWRWLTGVLEGGRRISVVRDLGADLAEIEVSPSVAEDALSRTAFLARCEVAFAPLTYLCGLPGCLLGLSGDFQKRLISNSLYLALEHSEIPAIFRLGLEVLERFDDCLEGRRQIEAEVRFIRESISSLGIDVVANRYSCSVALASFAQAVGLRDALIEKGSLVAAFKVRVPFGERGFVRILPSVFHVEQDVSALLSAIGEIKRIRPALFYSNFK